MVSINAACFRVLAESPRRTGCPVFPLLPAPAPAPALQKVKVSFCLLAQCSLTGYIEYLGSHQRWQCGLRGSSSGCWETARGVLTAPTAHSYPKPGKAVCGNGYEGHGAAAPFPSRPRFLLWTGRRHLEGRAAYCQIEIVGSPPAYLPTSTVRPSWMICLPGLVVPVLFIHRMFC